ncbi:hypothetical protein GCM10011497_25830 [Elstera cyanobacteriorum]|uniref:Uncharacterized protein n=1 Tax=Elstera cyanobacteriorum TaxID=2022747 RepID=A0A255XML9_9PROT|nr:hypothetical protein [Elstera cyanobacteriorum]OYQ17510.1 hypothetical protein CHR90_16325 [Elstera cyanobacteriorum]GFZ94489.1 hypothetical protein GCM10011497_25830 [Elstera cyanobacteriorum]
MPSALLWPIPAQHLEAGSLLQVTRAALETEATLEAAKDKVERLAKAAKSEAMTLGLRASLLLVAATPDDMPAFEAAEDMLHSAIEKAPEDGRLWQAMGIALLRIAEAGGQPLPELLQGAEAALAKAQKLDVALNRLALTQARLLLALVEAAADSVTLETLEGIDAELAAAEARYKAAPLQVVTLLPLLDTLQVSARVDPDNTAKRLQRIVALLRVAVPKLPELKKTLPQLAELLLSGAQTVQDEDAAFALVKQANLTANDAVTLLPDALDARVLHGKTLIELAGYVDDSDAARLLYVALGRFEEAVAMTERRDASLLITLGNAHLLHARLVRDGEADLHFADALANYKAAAVVRGHRHTFHEAIVHALLGDEDAARIALEDCKDLPSPAVLLTLPGMEPYREQAWFTELLDIARQAEKAPSD